jgi:hypothetical protein
MKSPLKTLCISLIVLIIPVMLANGQGKKSEQKLKVVVNNGSGTKVVIDTVFYGSQHPDSIKLKDGSVIYIKHHGEQVDMKENNGKENFFVTYSSDDNNEGSEVNKEGRGNMKYKVITRSSRKEGDKSETIYINKNDSSDIDNEKTFDVYVSSDDKDSSVEKTKFVIAKDGMVVTIEGNDEAKAKELAKDIEAKLDVENKESDKKETVKVESKKIIKK